ncbi:MAG TPA: superoxide dismutase family protein [Ilumatobacteraceae bacterium]|nr:superoxide dismutase family protein [Ilumatobacteraceae bacterium]
MRNEPTGSHRSGSKKTAGITLAVAALAGAFTIASASGSASGDGWEAVAVLRDVGGNKVGKVKFEGDEHGTVVKATLNGVMVGLDAYHGFHLHANDVAGQCDPLPASGPFTNVGGHWNPTGAVHGGHSGDLPSIQVLADGSGEARSVTGRFDPSQIEGRAVILHAGPDNFGNIPTRYVAPLAPLGGPDIDTNKTGDSGVRIACGIVELD